MNTLRLSTIEERPLQASKWLESQALLDTDEIAALFEDLGPFFLYACGAVCEPGKGEVGKEEFLHHYSTYIDTLKRGEIPEPSTFRPFFSPAMTTTRDTLFAIPVANGKQIVRPAKPVVQMQAHHMSYSTVDKKFHPMVFGTDSISWGIQFSYPQLYQDNITKLVEPVKDTPTFPNTRLFHQLQRWMRQNTIPTPFIAENIPVNVPMRLGKNCLTWINSHAGLKAKGITVRC